MIQFDWDKIKRNTKGSNRGIVLAISAITYATPAPSKAQTFVNPHFWKDYSGCCFLLNPEKLLEQKYLLPNKTLVEYIMLASKRSLAEYLLTGRKTLDKRLANILPLDNQLLTITQDEVQFKYE